MVDLEGSALVMPNLPPSSIRQNIDLPPSSKTEPLCGFVGVGGDSFAENSANSQEFAAWWGTKALSSMGY